MKDKVKEFEKEIVIIIEGLIGKYVINVALEWSSDL